jgi:uncharacterized protein YeaO (DUF488 family)
MVKLKRAYEPQAHADGYRVLVERLWPRGLRKQDLELDAWEKEVAPSPALRTWFGHDPRRWAEFQRRYRHELQHPAAAERVRELAYQAARGTITLIFSTRDVEHNSAVVLKEELERLVHRIQSEREQHPPGA